MINVNSKIGKIVLNDFSQMDLYNQKPKEQITCGKIYNFSNCNSSLKKGLGVRSFTTCKANDINSSRYSLNYQSLGLEYFNKVMHFKQYFSQTNQTTHRLLFHGSDGKIYIFQMFSNSNMLNWTYEMTFDNIPAVLEYKKDGLDAILISAEDKLVVWATNKTPYEIDAPTISSMCVHNDILYCTLAGETEKIWYTSNLDPESIGAESDTTKYLVLESGCGGGNKIVAFKENIYVFRDYGIGRINTYVKKEPTYNTIYLSDSKIYPNSISDCGDFVIFVTNDGVYKFNGSSITKIDSLSRIIINSIKEYAVATTLQDSYYLALKINFDDDNIVGCESEEDMKNNALLKVNLNDYSFEIMRGVDIKEMLALKAGVEEKIVITFNSTHKDKVAEITSDGKCFDEILPKVYSSNYVVQGNMDNMTIRKISIEGSKGIEFKIIADSKEFCFNTYCNGFNHFQTIIPCCKFKIEINSSIEEPYLNLIQIEYETHK